MRIILLLALTIALPVAWLVAEFTARAGIRRCIGVVTILWSFGIAAMVGLLQNFNANSYFTGATKVLFSASVEQLKAGKTTSVVRAWSRANDEFRTTYENRGHYREVVDEAIADMKKP